MQQGLPVAPGVQTLEVDVPYAADGHVIVDVSAKARHAEPAVAAERLQPRGQGDRHRQRARCTSTSAQVEQIAAEPDVLFVQPRQGRFTSRVGPRPSRDQMIPRAARRKAVLESLRAALAARTLAASDGHARPDPVHPGTGGPSAPGKPRRHGGRLGELAGGRQTHRAAVFRGLTGANGAGVGSACSRTALTTWRRAGARRSCRGHGAARPVRFRRRRHGDARDHSRPRARRAAVLRHRVHVDHPASPQNIRALRAAGCDIIVDDVFYFVESPFQDGQARPWSRRPTAESSPRPSTTSSRAGALYFSSAGNSGNLNDGTSGTLGRRLRRRRRRDIRRSRRSGRLHPSRRAGLQPVHRRGSARSIVLVGSARRIVATTTTSSV